jgi:hypothetical protein
VRLRSMRAWIFSSSVPSVTSLNTCQTRCCQTRCHPICDRVQAQRVRFPSTSVQRDESLAPSRATLWSRFLRRRPKVDFGRR